MTQVSQAAIVMGPSGCGKNTMIDGAEKLLASSAFSRLPPRKIVRAITATTRELRSGEVHGKDYFSYSLDEFRERERAGEFVETAQVHGNWYGSPKTELRRSDPDVLVLIHAEVQGAPAIKEYTNGIVFLILPPGRNMKEQLRELYLRLRERGDKVKSIRTRLRTAKHELEVVPQLLEAGVIDHVHINADKEEAARWFAGLLAAPARCPVTAAERELYTVPGI